MYPSKYGIIFTDCQTGDGESEADIPMAQISSKVSMMSDLRISESKLYKMTSVREVPHGKVGRQLRFKKSELDEFLENEKRPKFELRMDRVSLLASRSRPNAYFLWKSFHIGPPNFILQNIAFCGNISKWKFRLRFFIKLLPLFEIRSASIFSFGSKKDLTK
jgi:excisionase family DNA binding protein